MVTSGGFSQSASQPVAAHKADKGRVPDPVHSSSHHPSAHNREPVPCWFSTPGLDPFIGGDDPVDEAVCWLVHDLPRRIGIEPGNDLLGTL